MEPGLSLAAPGWLSLGLVAGCALLVFWTFRERRHWGDGPTIVGLFSGTIGRGAIAEVFYWVHASTTCSGWRS